MDTEDWPRAETSRRNPLSKGKEEALRKEETRSRKEGRLTSQAQPLGKLTAQGTMRSSSLN
jgi:hypothetical protein